MHERTVAFKIHQIRQNILNLLYPVGYHDDSSMNEHTINMETTTKDRQSPHSKKTETRESCFYIRLSIIRTDFTAYLGQFIQNPCGGRNCCHFFVVRKSSTDFASSIGSLEEFTTFVGNYLIFSSPSEVASLCQYLEVKLQVTKIANRV